MNKEFLIRLRESVEFQAVMTDALKMRPVVPQWRPANQEQGAQLMEEIKYQSGAQAGFDSLYLLLTGKDLKNG